MVNIQYVKFGEIKIDGNVYYSDMMVWWDGEKDFVEKSHVFGMEKFCMMIKRRPDVIVVGTGNQGAVMIADDVREAARERGIKIFEDTSAKAADIFNGMVATGKKAVAYVHTTS